MKVDDLRMLLGLNVFTALVLPGKVITGGYTSDLLSDVMGNIDEGMLWITMQTHRNIVAVGSLKDVSAIIIVNGAQPEEDTLQEADKEGVVVLGTTMSAFELSGKIYGIMQTCQV